LDKRQAFLSELDRRWPRLAREIRAAFKGLRDAADMTALRAAVEAQDVAAAMRAIGMDAGALGAVTASLAATYTAAGQAQVEAVRKASRARGVPRGARITAGFDPGNPVAAEWARKLSSGRIQEIAEDTREGIRATIRAGLDAGQSPLDTARDVRGMIGLHSQQAAYVRNARAELADPARMANYFTRERRDRRFDPTVRKAMREGRALTRKEIDRIAGRYSERLLIYRSETIARTETLAALSAGRDEGIRQLVESGKIEADQVTRKWDATGDSKTRPSHAAADGQERAQGQPFAVGGYPMQHPGDTSLGAPAGEVANCRCFMAISVSFFKGLR